MSGTSQRTIETLKRTLQHPDRSQLLGQFAEIVEARSYLQHGITVGDGDVVLDVGANVGVAAAFFATECRAGLVHCFEPIPAIFQVLRENLRGFPACTPHPYGLASAAKTETVTFYPKVWAMSGAGAEPDVDRENLRIAMRNMGASEEEADSGVRDRFVAEQVACEFRTLSQALREESIERVDLLKIDVERAELDVLAGIEEADWPRIRQIVAELHLEAAGTASAVGLLEQRGFDVTVVQDPAMEGTPVQMAYAVRN